MLDLIHFFWEGSISARRFELLQNCLYTTSAYNPTHQIIIWSNTLKQEQFDPLYNILVKPWSREDFKGIPVDDNIIDTYLAADKRTVSDFFRLVLLYKHGGSYCDTDDICIGPITTTKNVICRQYDPHTIHYSKVKDEDCLSGTLREIRGYDHIPFAPRNDCWMNFEPQNPFIARMFTHHDFVNAKHPISILDNTSFQSLTLKVAKDDSTPCVFGLNLLYFYESFLVGCSPWDTAEAQGEMHDFYRTLPDSEAYRFGQYVCNRHEARSAMFELLNRYPHLSHAWMHGKEDMAELFKIPDPESLQQLSVWFYHYNIEYMKLLV